VAPEEVDKLAFLFGAQVGPKLDGLGRVHGVDLHGLGVLSGLEGARHGGHGWADLEGGALWQNSFSSLAVTAVVPSSMLLCL
jgi:hypothetical protein